MVLRSTPVADPTSELRKLSQESQELGLTVDEHHRELAARRVELTGLQQAAPAAKAAAARGDAAAWPKHAAALQTVAQRIGELEALMEGARLARSEIAAERDAVVRAHRPWFIARAYEASTAHLAARQGVIDAIAEVERSDRAASSAWILTRATRDEPYYSSLDMEALRFVVGKWFQVKPYPRHMVPVDDELDAAAR